MDAAEDLSIGFHAVADHPALAVRANRRERVDCAFEAIEGVMLAGNDHFKRLVIFIFANFACSHTQIVSRAVAFAAVFAFVFASNKLVRSAECPVCASSALVYRGSCSLPLSYSFSEVEIAREK
jgi:hypothetical protein